MREPLFKKELQEEDLIPIGTNPELWEDNIIRYAFSIYPELHQYELGFKWTKISNSNGLGLLKIKKANETAHIIIIVRNGNLYPLDVYIKNRKFGYLTKIAELFMAESQLTDKPKVPEEFPVGTLSPLVSLTEMLKTGQENEKLISRLMKIKIPCYFGQIKDDVLLITKKGNEFEIDSFSNIIFNQQPIKLNFKQFKKVSELIENHDHKIYKVDNNVYLIEIPPKKYASFVFEKEEKLTNKLGSYYLNINNQKERGQIFEYGKDRIFITEDGRYLIKQGFNVIKKAEEITLEPLPKTAATEGFLIYKNKAYGPIKILKVSEKNGELTYKATYLDQPITLKFANIKKPETDGNIFYFPLKTLFKKANDKIIEETKDLLKDAEDLTTVEILKRNNEFRIKLASFNKTYSTTYPFNRSFCLLTGIGIKPKFAYLILKNLEENKKIAFLLKNITKELPKIVTNKELEKYAQKIRKNLLKQAQEIDKIDSEVANLLFSLNFVSPENLYSFASLIQNFENAKEKLARYLVQARMGTLDISPMIIKQAINGINTALTEFKQVLTKLK